MNGIGRFHGDEISKGWNQYSYVVVREQILDMTRFKISLHGSSSKWTLNKGKYHCILRPEIHIRDLSVESIMLWSSLTLYETWQFKGYFGYGMICMIGACSQDVVWFSYSLRVRHLRPYLKLNNIRERSRSMSHVQHDGLKQRDDWYLLPDASFRALEVLGLDWMLLS